MNKDEAINSLLKLALEYNASILSMATAYYGRMATANPHQQKRVFDQIRKIQKRYIADQEKVIASVEEYLLSTELPKPRPTRPVK